MVDETLAAADQPLLKLDSIVVQRDGFKILNGVSTVLPRGRHTAILGPNGAGKTSLLKLLLRQFYPSVVDDSQGRVEILGRTDWEVGELKKHMGVVASSLDVAFSTGRTGRMTVLEAVASGFTGTELAEFGVEITEKVRERVEFALRSVDAISLLPRRVETLSTGERRRTLIARALVHEPEILVLDEPTTGLDVVARHHFLCMLRELVSIRSLTLLLVTHHVEEIIPEIRHVLLLGEGQIVFDGDKEKALTSQNLSTLYKNQLVVQHHTDGTITATVA